MGRPQAGGSGVTSAAIRASFHTLLERLQATRFAKWATRTRTTHTARQHCRASHYLTALNRTSFEGHHAYRCSARSHRAFAAHGRFARVCFALLYAVPARTRARRRWFCIDGWHVVLCCRSTPSPTIITRLPRLRLAIHTALALLAACHICLSTSEQRRHAPFIPVATHAHRTYHWPYLYGAACRPRWLPTGAACNGAGVTHQRSAAHTHLTLTALQHIPYTTTALRITHIPTMAGAVYLHKTPAPTSSRWKSCHTTTRCPFHHLPSGLQPATFPRSTPTHLPPPPHPTVRAATPLHHHLYLHILRSDVRTGKLCRLLCWVISWTSVAATTFTYYAPVRTGRG